MTDATKRNNAFLSHRKALYSKALIFENKFSYHFLIVNYYKLNYILALQTHCD